MNHRKLRAKMVERGYNTERLAAALGVAVTTIRNKLAGRTEFTQHEISGICKCLDITCNELLDIFFSEEVS